MQWYQWYPTVLRQYAEFTGRAHRAEYWWFTLVNTIISFALYIPALAGVLELLYVYVAYVLAVFLPSLAVMVRRLHDTGRSGWWYFISFVPLIGAIVLLVFLATEGDRHPNAYGPDPRAETAGVG